MEQGSDSANPTTTFPELARPVPRTVRVTGTGWANVALLMVIFGVAAASLVYVSNSALHVYTTRNTLRTAASETMGQITREWTSGKRSSTQHIGYAFEVNGTTYSGEAIVPGTIWESLKSEGTVNIKYSPSDPRINYPADWEDSIEGTLSPLIFVAMLSIFGLVLSKLLRTQYRLVAEGLPALARVTERVMGRRGFVLKYEFQTEGGGIAKGSCSEEERREVGSTISVIYLPNSPRTSKLYPIPTFKVDG
jgi:hypothetical protein